MDTALIKESERTSSIVCMLFLLLYVASNACTNDENDHMIVSRCIRLRLRTTHMGSGTPLTMIKHSPMHVMHSNSEWEHETIEKKLCNPKDAVGRSRCTQTQVTTGHEYVAIFHFFFKETEASKH